MEEIKREISFFIDKYEKNVKYLKTLEKGLKWFMTHFKDVEFDHKDLRGGNITPTIILSTKISVVFDKEILKKDFEEHCDYVDFKECLLTFGTASLASSKKTYFYISCHEFNKTEGQNEIISAIEARINRELFPHFEKYFK